MAKPIVPKDKLRIKKSIVPRTSLSNLNPLNEYIKAIIYDLSAIVRMDGDLTLSGLINQISLNPDITVREFFEILHINKLISLQIEVDEIIAEWLKSEKIGYKWVNENGEEE